MNIVATTMVDELYIRFGGYENLSYISRELIIKAYGEDSCIDKDFD